MATDGHSQEEQNAMLNAIAPLVPGIVTSFILLAEFVDDEGDKNIFASTMVDQRAHVTLGLLAFGDAVERRRVTDSFYGHADE